MKDKELTDLLALRSNAVAEELNGRASAVETVYPLQEGCEAAALSTVQRSMRAIAAECYPLGTYTAPAEYLVDGATPGVLRKKTPA